MRKEDWQSAFGRPSREFERSVDRVLESLPEVSGAAQKEGARAKARTDVRKPEYDAAACARAASSAQTRHASNAKRTHGKKRRGRARQLLAMAACMVMLCGAALAVGHRAGVFDFLDRVMPLAAAPDMSQDERQQLLQSPALSIRGEYAVCTLEEALFDGRSMTVSFRISPLDGEHTLLMSGYLYDVNDNIPEDWLGGDEHTGETFAERAAREGKQVVTVSASMQPPGGYDDAAALDYMENYNSDGSITIFANMRLKRAVEDAIGMDCTLTETAQGADSTIKRKSGFTIAPNMDLERVTLGECDIEATHIDGVEIMRSQLGMYVSAAGTLNPGYEGTLVMIGIDEQGGGVISGGMALEAGASDEPSGGTCASDADAAMDDATPQPAAGFAEDGMHDASVLRRFSIDEVFKAGEGMPRAIWLLAQDEEGGAIGEPLKIDIDKDGGIAR